MPVRRTVKRVLSLASAVLLVVALSLMCSCNNDKPIGDRPVELPLKEERTISYWLAYDGLYTPDYETYADHPFFKRLKEKTNINIEFVVPSVERMDIGLCRSEWVGRIAADDTTDMVSHFWFVPDSEGSTIDSLADEELYYELSSYVDMQMPNFNALREEYVNIDKLMYTPYNKIMFIPQLTGIEDLNKTAPVTSGLIMRKDFLDELQMDVPVTVDDWYNVLTAFKVKLGVESPFWLGAMNLAPGCVGDAFISCYGQAYELYLDKDGNVCYGAIEEGTRKYVEMMNKWVAEGLANVTRDITLADKESDEVGAWGGDINDIANRKSAANPNYELVACPYPVVTPGDKLDIRSSYMPIGNREINSIYVCQSYDDPGLACKWIDQLFTAEAYNEASYGVEGEDYTKDADGNITFTDKILKHADGPMYGVSQNCYLGNMWADRDVLVNLVYGENVKKAVETWSNATSERNMIRSTSVQFTSEEADQLSGLANFWMNQTGTLKAMIKGERDLSEWDAFVASMNEGGLAEYIAIYQSGWDRYLAM